MNGKGRLRNSSRTGKDTRFVGVIVGSRPWSGLARSLPVTSAIRIHTLRPLRSWEYSINFGSGLNFCSPHNSSATKIKLFISLMHSCQAHILRQSSLLPKHTPNCQTAPHAEALVQLEAFLPRQPECLTRCYDLLLLLLLPYLPTTLPTYDLTYLLFTCLLPYLTTAIPTY